MMQDRLERLKDLYHAALERSPAERSGFLDRECGDDPSVRGQVENLLGARADADVFFATPAWAPFAELTENVADDSPAPEAEPGLPFERLGEFRLVRRIGAGGMGTVYLALQEPMGRAVALKVIRFDLAASPDAQKRFLREVEAVANLRHPNIVTVHGSGEDKGMRYFAMELVPGQDLDQVLRETASRGEKTPLPALLGWAVDVADALDSAHAAGIVHRDIKPSNIRIEPGRGAKVMDFGVARHLNLSAMTLSGQFRGTPHYAAPEQLKGPRHAIDARTDVYSLGVTLYQAVCGRVPFDGETTEQVFRQILDEDPVPPRRLNPAISRDVQTVVLTAMEKDPARRYQTAALLADDLRRVLAGDAILARPAGVATRAWKRIRRRPVLATALTSALLTVTGFLGYVLLWSYPEAQARYQEIRRLSDVKRLAILEEDARALWPAVPAKVPAMEAWISRARSLIDRIDLHRQALDNLLRSVPMSQDGAPIFPDTEIRWRHDILSELVEGLGALADEETGTLKKVQDRLGFAKAVHDETIVNYAGEWESAIASIADREEYPRYDGLVLDARLGMVPLGPDPESGLFEFAHIQTGEIPARGPDGRIRLTEESGLVFVLVPGGTFDMGAVPPGPEHPVGSPNVDPRARAIEAPVHTVTVRPFLLSKYEMTQGQWLRFTGHNPSAYRPGDEYGDKRLTLLHPVEQVSWEDATLILSHLDLRLPTEAEWEYATRGGTTTVWWSGNERESLDGATNLADQFFEKYGGYLEWGIEDWLVDGYVTHSPVGIFRPNPFGFHDMDGNVCEWCQDSTDGNSYDGAPTDGSAWDTEGSVIRVYRGGCWDGNSNTCRAAARLMADKGSRFDGFGIRPAADLR